jgi:hypothetical protein
VSVSPAVDCSIPLKPTTDPQEADHETICNICANPIINFIPDNFLSEVINPACEGCKDIAEISDANKTKPPSAEDTPPMQDYQPSIGDPFTPRGFNNHPTRATNSSSSPANCPHDQQCIIRKPFPPPLPAVTPLVNMYSLYHIKIDQNKVAYRK